MKFPFREIVELIIYKFKFINKRYDEESPWIQQEILRFAQDDKLVTYIIPVYRVRELAMTDY